MIAYPKIEESPRVCSMNLTSEFADLIRGMQQAGIPFAVCGGMALALHGFPRFTNDIDLLILPGQFENAVNVARQCGFNDAIEAIRLGRQSGRPVEIHRINKFVGEDFLTLDLILVSPVLEQVWNDQMQFEWQGRLLPVVSRTGLAKMKRMAGRPQDLADIQNLGFQLDDPSIQP
jgi:nucleotidyltransferase AbiEii toxin of type IV toxin-antitoxin system